MLLQKFNFLQILQCPIKSTERPNNQTFRDIFFLARYIQHIKLLQDLRDKGSKTNWVDMEVPHFCKLWIKNFESNYAQEGGLKFLWYNLSTIPHSLMFIWFVAARGRFQKALSNENNDLLQELEVRGNQDFKTGGN